MEKVRWTKSKGKRAKIGIMLISHKSRIPRVEGILGVTQHSSGVLCAGHFKFCCGWMKHSPDSSIPAKFLRRF